ncbi:hypothetical protein Sjap_001369 [Stephania japonica]|uniref:RING-type domain-containing protein n=1 Tax=Stephania japonica TaxID=461633 RepID=A0AAP0KLK2_9MAGN
MEEVPYWDAQLFHDDDDDDDDETDDRYSENDDNDEGESYEDNDDDDDEDDLQSEDEEDDVPPPIARQIEVTGQEGEVASAVSSDGGGDQRDGLCCPICLEPWSSVGDHYVCCLPCGHLYGFSCIEKWLKRRKNHAPSALNVVESTETTILRSSMFHRSVLLTVT